MQLLGWEIKRSSEGSLPDFGWTWVTLGVQFCTDGLRNHRCLTISNKPGRADKVRELVELLCGRTGSTRRCAERLRGLLHFSRAQCFGRCGAFAMHSVSALADGKAPYASPEVIAHLQWWIQYLHKAPPRRLDFNSAKAPLLLFVDGMEEETGSACSGVLLDPETNFRECFGKAIPTNVINSWKQLTMATRHIHCAELLPVAMSLVLWPSIFRGREFFVFVDNEAARLSLLKGSTSNKASASIVSAVWARICGLSCYLWFERVPSASNIS